VREDTCLAPPYRLLYTGRMAAEKGLLDLLEALALLVGRGEDVILDLVGWPQKNDPILEELRERAAARGLAGRVRYHGYKPVGPDLFAFYRQADLFVLASRSSFEGFPRAIWEAMAHSLPVVATEVGSIPQFVASAARLVPPGCPERMAEVLTSLLHNAPMRRESIQRGLVLARQNTLERQAEEMICAIQDYVSA
ncbi:MAG: glycosyltransferase family 4 protein, partial [Clostridia bacterium]|nr:glycosyltransferase family 4 protein [Clostridia bacterium]